MTDSPAASAGKAIAGAIVRHLINTAGTALVARGLVDQTTADSATGPVADYALGAVLLGGTYGWAAFRARASHWRWVRTLYAPALPRSSISS